MTAGWAATHSISPKQRAELEGLLALHRARGFDLTAEGVSLHLRCTDYLDNLSKLVDAVDWALACLECEPLDPLMRSRLAVIARGRANLLRASMAEVRQSGTQRRTLARQRRSHASQDGASTWPPRGIAIVLGLPAVVDDVVAALPALLAFVAVLIAAEVLWAIYVRLG
jgi:hypothetical protein